MPPTMRDAVGGPAAMRVAKPPISCVTTRVAPSPSAVTRRRVRESSQVDVERRARTSASRSATGAEADGHAVVVALDRGDHEVGCGRRRRAGRAMRGRRRARPRSRRSTSRSTAAADLRRRCRRARTRRARPGASAGHRPDDARAGRSRGDETGARIEEHRRPRRPRTTRDARSPSARPRVSAPRPSEAAGRRQRRRPGRTSPSIGSMPSPEVARYPNAVAVEHDGARIDPRVRVAGGSRRRRRCRGRRRSA